jgi:lipid-A-disaccharide synthase
MLIAGEASGDLLAAELVQALRREFADARPLPSTDAQPLETGLAPQFFGAGGPRMAAAGVALALDLTTHSVIGPTDALQGYFKFRRFFRQLFQLAVARQPDVIICVDYQFFNRRFARALQRYTRSRADWFHDWRPKVVQYVSPQVWASREGRAYQMDRDYDLLLSIFPFEKGWYAERVPQLTVEFVGHPMVERYRRVNERRGEGRAPAGKPLVVLLPGSRRGELRRHMPVLAEAAQRIAATCEVAFRMVLPNESLVAYARPFESRIPGFELQVGQLGEALERATVAITKSGTASLECAFFGVPAVVFYKTSRITYLVGRQLVKVKHIGMPNLLANEAVYPEFIQDAASAEHLARATLELLGSAEKRAQIKAKLAQVVRDLGPPGASGRAAKAIVRLLN